MMAGGRRPFSVLPQEEVGGRDGGGGGCGDGSCDEARCKHEQSSLKPWMAARFSLTVFGLL